jgi:hypothetical protein
MISDSKARSSSVSGLARPGSDSSYSSSGRIRLRLGPTQSRADSSSGTGCAVNKFTANNFTGQQVYSLRIPLEFFSYLAAGAAAVQQQQRRYRIAPTIDCIAIQRTPPHSPAPSNRSSSLSFSFSPACTSSHLLAASPERPFRLADLGRRILAAPPARPARPRSSPRSLASPSRAYPPTMRGADHRYRAMTSRRSAKSMAMVAAASRSTPAGRTTPW